jgi:3-hydroxyisobutyrate dehydrogenase-like beta-hydroxyacid dehydrogenase
MHANIGVIGLGLLGSAIAHRLLQAPFPVIGYDPLIRQRESLVRMGGTAVESVDKVFAQCSVVVLSLPSSEVVRAVLDQAMIADEAVIIDTTTGDPREGVRHAEKLRSAGGLYIEANVAGSSVQTRNGEAVVFIGVNEKQSAVHRYGLHGDFVDSVLAAISTRQFVLGPVGAASRFKLVHNLLLGLHRAVLAEGLNFAESLGFDLQTTLSVLRETAAASNVMETKGSKMIDAEFTPQATLSQHLKDVRLILELADENGVSAPLSRQHQELLDRAEELGWGGQDNSSVIQAYRNIRFSPERMRDEC